MEEYLRSLGVLLKRTVSEPEAEETSDGEDEEQGLDGKDALKVRRTDELLKQVKPCYWSLVSCYKRGRRFFDTSSRNSIIPPTTFDD